MFVRNAEGEAVMVTVRRVLALLNREKEKYVEDGSFSPSEITLYDHGNTVYVFWNYFHNGKIFDCVSSLLIDGNLVRVMYGYPNTSSKGKVFTVDFRGLRKKETKEKYLIRLVKNVMHYLRVLRYAVNYGLEVEKKYLGFRFAGVDIFLDLTQSVKVNYAKAVYSRNRLPPKIYHVDVIFDFKGSVIKVRRYDVFDLGFPTTPILPDFIVEGSVVDGEDMFDVFEVLFLSRTGEEK